MGLMGGGTGRAAVVGPSEGTTGLRKSGRSVCAEAATVKKMKEKMREILESTTTKENT
jgi:hypothetical protein